MKKIVYAMLILVAGVAAPLFGELPASLRGLFSEADAATLDTKGELSSIFKEHEPLRFVPKLALGGTVREAVTRMNPIFGVEYCVVHKTRQSLDSEVARDGIYNTLLGISTLKGIEYYSASRKRMRELFIDAYCVPAPERKDRLPDPVNNGPIPSVRLINTFQHDSSFGENFYTVEYRYTDKAFLMTMRNSNKIWYGIIPLIDPGNLAYYIVIYPVGEYILFYSVVCVNGANPLGLMESKTESFYNRIKALDNWFQKQSGLF
jgi:hypothetical protein